jgi:hypothetical protein
MPLPKPSSLFRSQRHGHSITRKYSSTLIQAPAALPTTRIPFQQRPQHIAKVAAAKQRLLITQNQKIKTLKKKQMRGRKSSLALMLP